MLYLTDDDLSTLDHKAPSWMDCELLSKWRLRNYQLPDQEMVAAPAEALDPVDCGGGIFLTLGC